MSFLCPAFSDNHLEAGRLIVGDPSVAASLGLRFTTPAQDGGQAENGIRPARNATLARASEHSVVGGLRDSLDSSSALGLPAVAAKREGWVAVLVDRFPVFIRFHTSFDSTAEENPESKFPPRRSLLSLMLQSDTLRVGC